MDINFNWDLYDFGTEKIKFRLKVAYECFNHSASHTGFGELVVSAQITVDFKLNKKYSPG